MKIKFLKMITFTLLLLILGGLVLNAEGNASDIVVLASKPFTESYILTEIMVLLLDSMTPI